MLALRTIAVYALLPWAYLWVRHEESRIVRTGRPLDERETHDARRAGVSAPERIRVQVVDEIPPALSRALRRLLLRLGMVESAGMCLRYGIYVEATCARSRRVLVHEMAHTAQYERIGGIWPFLRRYLRECLTDGYANSALEAEAQRTTQDICR